jgi:hypothetical protein
VHALPTPTHTQRRPQPRRWPSGLGLGPGPGLKTDATHWIGQGGRAGWRGPGRRSKDGLGRGRVPRINGDVKRGAAGAAPQANEARAGEGGEQGRHRSMVAGAGDVKARVIEGSLRREQERLPARLDQSLCNLEVPDLASDIEAGESVLVCLEKKSLK